MLSRERIEAGFERWARFVFRHRWATIVLTLALSGVCISQLPRLQLETSTEGFIGITIIYYVVAPLSSLIGGLLISFLFSYGIKLCQLAKTIKISLHMDTSYSVIANPITRLLVVFLIVVSLLPLFSYLVDQRLFTDFLIGSFAFFIFTAIPLFILFCIPIVTLARRIRAIKDSELSIIREELMHIEAGIRSESNQVDSLMVRQMFIESRKEWPIGPQLQRVFFFGLLPPLTWTLAATIENILKMGLLPKQSPVMQPRWFM